MAIDRIAACIFVIAGGSLEDHQRILGGSRRAEQGILKYHYNFSLYLGCLWPDFQTVFSK